MMEIVKQSVLVLKSSGLEGFYLFFLCIKLDSTLIQITLSYTQNKQPCLALQHAACRTQEPLCVVLYEINSDFVCGMFASHTFVPFE